MSLQIPALDSFLHLIATPLHAAAGVLAIVMPAGSFGSKVASDQSFYEEQRSSGGFGRALQEDGPDLSQLSGLGLSTAMSSEDIDLDFKGEADYSQLVFLAQAVGLVMALVIHAVKARRRTGWAAPRAPTQIDKAGS